MRTEAEWHNLEAERDQNAINYGLEKDDHDRTKAERNAFQDQCISLKHKARIADGERDALIRAVADHVTVRAEQYAQIQALSVRVTDKPVAAQEPVFFVSPGQLPSIKDSGYWPYRKQMEGLFTLPLYSHAAPCARCVELDPQQLREFMRAMQAGEMTVSRGIELIDMWIAGNYSDDQLPPVQNTLGEDEWPMQKLTEQAERIKALEEMHLPIGSMVVAGLRARCEKAETIAEAARNLIAQKGRHNTEIAYKRLEEAITKERAS